LIVHLLRKIGGSVIACSIIAYERIK